MYYKRKNGWKYDGENIWITLRMCWMYLYIENIPMAWNCIVNSSNYLFAKVWKAYSAYLSFTRLITNSCDCVAFNWWKLCSKYFCYGETFFLPLFLSLGTTHIKLKLGSNQIIFTEQNTLGRVVHEIETVFKMNE